MILLVASSGTSLGPGGGRLLPNRNFLIASNLSENQSPILETKLVTLSIIGAIKSFTLSRRPVNSFPALPNNSPNHSPILSRPSFMLSQRFEKKDVNASLNCVHITATIPAIKANPKSAFIILPGENISIILAKNPFFSSAGFFESPLTKSIFGVGESDLLLVSAVGDEEDTSLPVLIFTYSARSFAINAKLSAILDIISKLDDFLTNVGE